MENSVQGRPEHANVTYFFVCQPLNYRQNSNPNDRLVGNTTLLTKAFAIVGLFVVFALPAKADLLRAMRPGVMCTSADALAKLSLPDGSSRTAAPNVSPDVAATARTGGCVDFPVGNIVILLTRHNNTSIVRSDTLTGDGVLDTFIVPNIDYAPYSPPVDEFDNAIRARCPTKLDEVVVLRAPLGYFIESLPKATRDSIDKAIEDECQGAGPCSISQRAVEVSKRHLVQQWAAFTCRKL